MAITAEARSELITLVVAMFNAAPGAAVLSDLAAASEAGYSLKDIANSLAGTTQFTSIYPNFLTNQEFATKLVNNMVGDLVTAENKAAGVAELVAALNAGMTRVDVVIAAATALVSAPADDENWGAARTAFDNKVEVATYFSVELQANAADLEGLQAVIADVDNTDASVTAAKNAAEGNANEGQTFNLTQGLDNLVGTSGNDTFNAFAFNSISGADTTTLQSVDTIDGGAGTDTLNIEVKADGLVNDFNGAFVGTISNIEIININNSAANSAAAVSGTAFGSAAEQIWQIGQAGAVTNLGANTAAGFRQVSAAVSVTSASSAATQTIALDRFAEGQTITSAGNSLSSINIAGTVSDSNSDGTVATTTLAATAGVNVTSLKLNTAVRTDLTITKNAGNTAGINLTEIDASGSTGRVTYNATANADIASYKGGSGVDTITLATATSATVGAVVDGGAGNDTITVNATGTGTVTVNGGAGDDTITIGGATTIGKLTVQGGEGDDVVVLSNGIASVRTTDVIDGGAGTDTISVAGKAFVAEDYILLNDVITNFETLRVTGGAATIDASKLAGYSKFEGYGAASTFTKVGADQSIVAAAGVTATAAGYSSATTPTTYAGTLNITGIGSGTVTANAETLKLTVFAVANNDSAVDNVAVTVAGDVKTATVTLVPAVDNNGTTTNTVDDFYDTVEVTLTNAANNAKLSSLTLVGNGKATVTNEAGKDLVTVDASGLNSKTLAGGIADGLIYTSTNAKAETITLGAGQDSVTLGASTQGAMDTVNGLTLVAQANGTTLDTAKSDAIQINDNAATPNNVAGFVKVTTTATTLNLALVDIAADTTNDAVVFAFGGDTYIYVDTDASGDSTAANDVVDAADLLVKITGTVDLDLLVQALNA